MRYDLLKDILKEKDYLPVLKMNDGSPVTRENWQKRREELIELLEKYSYGHTPKCPVKVSGTVTFTDDKSYAGKVLNQKIDLTFETEHGKTTFPFEIFIPYKVKRPAAFLNLAFGRVPHRYIPVEEITDAGYALIVVDYRDMVNDKLRGDYSDGIAAHFGTTIEREPEEWGKIGMWAYGASRILDYLIAERSEEINTERVAVVGHSRLGKTALWCAAQDERFAMAISNNSGYGGAASSKHGNGERVDDFIKCGSWDWYCENFKLFRAELEDEKPYDQSFLLALIAPRYLAVGSAKLDRGADPESEFLTSLHASCAWELLGEQGLVTPDRMPTVGDHFMDGKVGYHYRDGRHFFSREDWNVYFKFLDEKFKD